MAILTTDRNLYRASNKSGPRFEHFRPGEIVTQMRGGVEWVLGPNQGGASTKEVPSGLKGTWYLLPPGTTYDDAALHVWNDYDDHWVWEPAKDMPLIEYLETLENLNARFTKIP